MWKDLLKETETMSEEVVEEEIGEKKQWRGFTLENDKDLIFNSSIPVLSFVKMVKNHRVDLVEEAMKSMIGYIEKKIGFVDSQDKLDHLVECAEELRNAAAREK